MIEVRLTVTEASWLVRAVDLHPTDDSPLADPLASAAEIPAGSAAERRVKQGLTHRGLLSKDSAVNPFAVSALRWLATPEEVWSLSLFGRGGASVVHLALRDGAAVECRRDAEGFTLRFPLPEKEARAWLEARVEGVDHGA